MMVPDAMPLIAADAADYADYRRFSPPCHISPPPFSPLMSFFDFRFH
jgi:hypothetical protein